MNTTNMDFNTKLVHAGGYEDQFGSATVPIYQTSTFAFKNAQHGADLFAGRDKGYIYTRIGNPTIDALERNIAELENGYRGIATASGMGAVNSVYFALLKAGDHMVSTNSVYGPSRGVMESFYANFGVESSYVDTSDIEKVKAAIKPNTKVLYLETPSNPTMLLTDIEACTAIAKEKGIVVVVDNTFSSPFLQKPLDLGADVVLHSVTKFINGHADIVGGIIVSKTPELDARIRKAMIMLGTNMDPHQAFMVIRGVKTLSIRQERAEENARKVADYLEKHPKIDWIKYPGLASHPQFELAKKQMSGFGSMISFGLKGGFEAGKTLMDSVHLAILAVSLGGVETLIQHPASMTHAGLSKEAREAADITDGLVRFSVGIESVNDIIADLEQALAKV